MKNEIDKMVYREDKPENINFLCWLDLWSIVYNIGFKFVVKKPTGFRR